MIYENLHWVGVGLVMATLVLHLIFRQRDDQHPKYRIVLEEGRGHLPQVREHGGWRFIEADGRTTRILSLRHDVLFADAWRNDLNGARNVVNAHRRANVVNPERVVWTSDEPDTPPPMPRKK